MKQFPKSLRVENKEKFKDIFLFRKKCYLRKELYEHIISHKESEYFALDAFFSSLNKDDAKEILSTLIEELKELGWNCKTSFGGTGLFIYSNDPPSNCWPEIGD